MKKGIGLAVVLGILIGVTLGYTPFVSPTAAPRAMFLMQQTGQPNAVQATPQPSIDLRPVLIALAAGLVIAIPTFAFAKRRSK